MALQARSRRHRAGLRRLRAAGLLRSLRRLEGQRSAASGRETIPPRRGRSFCRRDLGPGGLKVACDLNGYFGGLPRLPHLPPTGAQRATLEQQMKDLRN